MTTYTVTGDQYIKIDRRMSELKTHLASKKGSPVDPDEVLRTLQWWINGMPEETHVVAAPFTELDEFWKKGTPSEKAVAGFILRRTWAETLADLSYFRESDILAIEEIGRARFSILKTWLNEAEVQLGSLAEDKTGWYRTGGGLMPYDRLMVHAIEKESHDPSFSRMTGIVTFGDLAALSADDVRERLLRGFEREFFGENPPEAPDTEVEAGRRWIDHEVEKRMSSLHWLLGRIGFKWPRTS